MYILGLLLHYFNLCLTDRGGLKYPSLLLSNRMWNIYLYFRRIFPQIRTSSKIVDDLVEFIVPRLSKCDELKCSDDGRHCHILCSFLCKTFFLAVFRTQEKKFRVQCEKKPIVQNKPQKRKVVKLQK